MTDWAFPAELINARLLVCIVQGYREDGRPASYPMAELPDGSFAGLTWDGWHLLKRAQGANAQVSPNVLLDQPVVRWLLDHITCRLLRVTTTSATRAVLYARAVNDEHSDFTNLLARQFTPCAAYAHANDIQIVGRFSDHSGQFHRPGRTEAFRVIDNGDADLIIVNSLDRLYRSLGDFNNLVQSGYRIATPKDGEALSGAAGTVLRVVLNEFARIENEARR